jgi:alpha-methylacyl-CoA racemase
MPEDPPRPLLAAITVLDYGSMGPGARACRILADYGAKVVRVLPPADAGRHELPFYAYAAHRGMRACALDLKSDAGRAALLDLAGRSDVIVEAFRPGVADRLGIGYHAVRAVNPAVIYCAATSYGQSGPYSSWAGHDINLLAVTGYLSCGERAAGKAPALPGATVADAAGGGMHAAMAVLAALVGRAGDGRGCYLDVATTDGMLGLMALNLDEFLATGSVPAPGHGILTGRFACYGLYQCGDGGWVSVGAVEPRFFANLCAVLGIADRAKRQYQPEAQAALRAELRAAFASRCRDEWMAVLGPADTCVAPVYDVAEVVDDPHHQSRGVFVDARDEAHGHLRQVGPLWAGCLGQDEPYDLSRSDLCE